MGTVCCGRGTEDGRLECAAGLARVIFTCCWGRCEPAQPATAGGTHPGLCKVGTRALCANPRTPAKGYASTATLTAQLPARSWAGPGPGWTGCWGPWTGRHTSRAAGRPPRFPCKQEQRGNAGQIGKQADGPLQSRAVGRRPQSACAVSLECQGTQPAHVIQTCTRAATQLHPPHSPQQPCLKRSRSTTYSAEMWYGLPCRWSRQKPCNTGRRGGPAHITEQCRVVGASASSVCLAAWRQADRQLRSRP